jgi:hypothetical protein
MHSIENAPRNQLLQMMLGVAQTQLIRVAAELGIADLVRAGPQSVEDLSAATGTEVPVLVRVLRALVSIGVLAETVPGIFGGTLLTSLLQTDHANSLRDYARLMGGVWLHQTWPLLAQTVQTGASAFEAVFAQPFYGFMQGNPDEAEVFNAAMSAVSGQESVALQEVFDFSSVTTVVDVGGGVGSLLAALLRAHPALHGILLDLPRMTERARDVLAPEMASGRCQIVAGDCLHAIPGRGDVYILKRVLIDNDDSRARTLLTRIRKAMQPNGRLLIAEPGLATQFGTSFDLLLMLLLFGSGCRIRTEPDMRALLESTGFALVRSVPAPPSLRLVEGVPV